MGCGRTAQVSIGFGRTLAASARRFSFSKEEGRKIIDKPLKTDRSTNLASYSLFPLLSGAGQGRVKRCSVARRPTSVCFCPLSNRSLQFRTYFGSGADKLSPISLDTDQLSPHGIGRENANKASIAGPQLKYSHPICVILLPKTRMLVSLAIEDIEEQRC